MINQAYYNSINTFNNSIIGQIHLVCKIIQTFSCWIIACNNWISASDNSVVELSIIVIKGSANLIAVHGGSAHN